MTFLQINCNWTDNSATYNISFPWLDWAINKTHKLFGHKKLVLIRVEGIYAIEAVKEFISLTGYGLKESKDIVDGVRAGGTWTYPGKDLPDVSKCQYLRFALR